MGDSEFAGYVDAISAESISGWAASPHAPTRQVSVSIYANGTRVGTATCVAERMDAVAAGYPGARAFSFKLKPLLAVGEHVIEVAFEDTLRAIPNGRGVVNVQREASASTGNDGAIGNYWNSQYSSNRHNLITRWWQCDYIMRRINKRICGEAIPGISSGLHRRAMQRLTGLTPFGKGVSIGCGFGHKERAAVECGLVQSFDLFDLSSEAIEQGRQAAQAAGLADRMNFILGNGLEDDTPERYDAVYWNNSLHHMFDAARAVEWSWRTLRKGGVFLMDDFVGPTRMQWSDRLLQVNSAIRSHLPARYLQDPHNPERLVHNIMSRPSIASMMAADPSECADSSNILPSLKRFFPDADVVLTGGGIYHMALNDVLHNILQANDWGLLEQLLEQDDQLADSGETHYATVIAIK